MAFFIQLLSYWILLWIASRFVLKSQLRSHAKKARIAFAFSFIVAGIMHLIQPEAFTYMIKDFIPLAFELIILTGILEIALAVLLLAGKWQKKVGWTIILYLILIFPANIYVAINHLASPGGLPPAPLYTWSRLFFQPVYILWVYYSTIRPEELEQMLNKIPLGPRKKTT